MSLAALNTTFGRVMIGLTLGLFCGIFLGEMAESLEVIGRIYVALLQMTVLPYVLATLMSSIGGLEPKGAARLGVRAIALIVFLWAVSWLTVLVIPFAYPEWDSGSFFSSALTAEPVTFDVVSQFIPANIFSSLSNAAIPAVVVFSVSIGLALMTLPGKEKLLAALDILNNAFGRVASFVVKLAPFGIFAIAADAAGTLRIEEAGRLQIYLGTYVAAWAVLGFVTLPLLVALATPLSYGMVLRHARTAMITAFAANTVLVVLPLIAEESKKLLEQQKLRNADTDSTVDVLTPGAYTLPTAGTPISVAFILFAAWFAGSPLEFDQYPAFAFLGFMSSFGGMYLALPYMLDFFQIPADLFQLFVVGTVATSQLWSALAAMNGLVLCLLGACAVLGRLSWTPLMLAAGGSLVISAVFFWLLSFAFKDVLPDPGVGEQRLLSLQLIEEQVAVQEIANPEPLSAEDLKRDRLEVIRERGSLRVGVKGGLPPFAFRNVEDQMVGLDMELMHNLAGDLGVSLELVPTEWEEIEELIDGGGIDILIGGVSISPKRALFGTFTRSYLNETVAFLVRDHRRRDFGSWQEISEIPSLRLGIPPRFFQRQLERVLPDAEFHVMDSPTPFLRGQLEDIDALLVSAEMGSAWTLIYPQFSVVVPSDAETQVPTAFVVPAGSARFREFMDSWLEIQITVGAVNEYYRHWVLGQDAHGKAPRWSIIRDVLGWVE